MLVSSDDPQVIAHIADIICWSRLNLPRGRQYCHVPAVVHPGLVRGTWVRMRILSPTDFIL
jgi:hypothetical protein